MSGAAARDAAHAFRVRQHGSVPAVVAAHGGAAATVAAAAEAVDARDGGAAAPADDAAVAADDGGGGDCGAPDASRVVLHFDADAFYAQVEELRDPSLRDVPMAVTQKYIIVTANYPARAQGVRKLQLISAALDACPTLRLVPGEDLTPYRRVSAAMLAVLSRYGPAEKLGLDEVWVDVTRAAAQAAAAAAAAQQPLRWTGHVHVAARGVAAHNHHRPMDLTAAPDDAADAVDGGINQAAGGVPPPACRSDALLAAGSAIAAEARATLRRELGLRASAGIAHNKLLAKLVSGLHKPDDQTALPAAQAASFLAPLPVRCLRGVGSATEAALAARGVATVAQLRAQPRAALLRALGNRAAATLFEAARGRDASPVVPKAPPKAVSVEDSFRGVSSYEAADAVLRVLAPDLVARCADERAEHGRRPRTLQLRWRLAQAGGSSGRASATAPMPEELAARGAEGVSAAAAAAAVLRAAAALLRCSVRPPFCLTLLNLGATSFTDPVRAPPTTAPAAPAAAPPGAGDVVAAAAATHARRSYAHLPAAGAPLRSKREERQLREGPPPGGAADVADVAADTDEHADDACFDTGPYGAVERGSCSDDDDGGGGAWDEDLMAVMHGGGGGCVRMREDAPALAAAPPQRGEAAAPQHGLRRFFGSAAGPQQHEATAAADADNVRCAACGRLLPRAAAAEHADWHVAVELQRAERIGAASVSAEAPSTSAPAAPASGKKRNAAGPMDAFLRRAASKPP